MLAFFVLLFLFFIFSLYSFSFCFSISVLSLCALVACLSVYNCFLGSVFVSVYTSMDSFSVFLVVLTVWISMLMILVSLKYSYTFNSPSLFVFFVFFLMFITVVYFSTDNLFVFYVSFEASLLPTLVLILKWGYQPERLDAGVYFMMYTICASLPLLFMIMYFQSSCFTCSMSSFYPLCLLDAGVSSSLFSFSLMLAFLVKVPMWGVHLWLPKAHVEAPVSGSMILAGVLLKLGGYGLMKVYSLFYCFHTTLLNFFLSINLWGAFVVGFICLSSIDLKVLIAYSSIIHMGMMVVGIFSGSLVGWLGAMCMMIAHGFSSPGMFSLANFNYEVSGTRNIVLQKGVSSLHTMSAFFWFILLAANMAAPPSLNLVSELFICISVLKLGVWLSIVMGLVTFVSAVYNLYLYSSQQGSPSAFLLPGECITSSFLLSCVLHSLPVYVSILAIFCLYV